MGKARITQVAQGHTRIMTAETTAKSIVKIEDTAGTAEIAEIAEKVEITGIVEMAARVTVATTHTKAVAGVEAQKEMMTTGTVTVKVTRKETTRKMGKVLTMRHL